MIGKACSLQSFLYIQSILPVAAMTVKIMFKRLFVRCGDYVASRVCSLLRSLQSVESGGIVCLQTCQTVHERVAYSVESSEMLEKLLCRVLYMCILCFLLSLWSSVKDLQELTIETIHCSFRRDLKTICSVQVEVCSLQSSLQSLLSRRFSIFKA